MCSINNTQIITIKTSQLDSLNIKKPEIQRIIDKEKVTDIVKFQLEYHKKYGRFNFSASGPLNIHTWEDKNLLVDGQHRLSAIEKLYNEYSHDIEFYVILVKVDTKEELEFNYNMINKNTPLPDFSNFQSVDKNIPEIVAAKFQERYPNVWSKNSRSRRPKLYFNYFQETLAYLCQELNLTSVRELDNLILDYNKKLLNWDQSQFKVTDSVYNLAKNKQFYLGLFSHQNEIYGYDWARNIIFDKTGRIIKKSPSSTKKAKIPKKVKIDAWNTYIGRKNGEAICICCRINVIGQNDFQAGHIISEFNNGKVTIENILPICSGCNMSMGTTNMDEYIMKHYPNNYTKFISKDYRSNSGLFGFIGI